MLKNQAKPNLKSLKKIKESWDLKTLFYKSEKDPQIEKDIKVSEQAILKFAKKHKSGSWKKSSNSIIKAVEEYLDLDNLPASRPLYYFYYRQQLNAADTIAERMVNKISDRLTKVGNQILFFSLELGKLPKSIQRELLKDKKVESFKYYLESVFEDNKYRLTEPEEKILNLKSQTSNGLWVQGTEKIVSKLTIKWKGEDMPIHGALMQFEELPHKERHQMWDKIKEKLTSVGEVAENELVALALDKKINDELRGYKEPYSGTTRGFDSDDKTLESLVKVIETRGYELSRKFFTLKKKVLGKELTYIDRNEKIGKEIKISFPEAVEICRDTFYNFNPNYGEFFDEMLKRGQIDVWPKKGKGGGAFCSSGVGQPTLVFLNHNDSVESLRTLAHEMGHAIHSFRSKSQPAFYQDYSTLTAETASTFFESLMMEGLIEKADDKDKISLLNSMIGDKIGTMIMCIARFKFELSYHETVRKEGGMTWQEMSAGLAKNFADYTGKDVKTLPEHGLIVLSKPHYRMNFYQYSYSFGEIGSSIMRAKYKKDKSYAEKVDSFLSQGGRASVNDIFKSIGIDMSKTDTYHLGLDLLEADIKKFEELVSEK